jgi:starch phosphorylase
MDYNEDLKKLNKLARNFWFCWNPEVLELFQELHPAKWKSSNNNPVGFLSTVSDKVVQKKLQDVHYQHKLKTCYDKLISYLQDRETPFKRNFPQMKEQCIAYFSAEYGIHESLPNYAGGLGVLAGDHAKSASDLGLPLVAVGLMYKHAYFIQEIDVWGNQTERYEQLDIRKLPVSLVKDEHGEPLLVSVPLLGRDVYIKIWLVEVGRVKVYLLDTVVDRNSEEDQNIIHSLYGGSRDTRIRQEIILGIGGLRALREMGIQPTVFHMNEGHSAFLGLERLYELMNEGFNFKTALEFVRATTIFTTHTPVPAGNEEFDFGTMEIYFANFWPELEISHEKFFDLGRDINIHQHQNFSLTILALNLSGQANGVSRLHGEVSRNMWQMVWPGIPTQEIPIGHVTNGVHTFSWMHSEMFKLLDTYMGANWQKQIRNQEFWDKFFEIPDKVLWKAKKIMKNEMIQKIRANYKQRIDRYGEERGGYPAVEEILDPDVLTIGFARRFAPYKRSCLFFRDIERIKKILNHPQQPVQILFAGKSHPANGAGKDLIRQINEISKQDGFRGKVVFVEEYNINIARALVTGVDIWLNTPRRPLEASGTSGEKVPINCGINLSILDGWWFEGYNGQNGWAIGESQLYEDNEKQDIDDSNSLYDLLEKEVVPLYYNKNNEGLSPEWIDKVKQSFSSIVTTFSAHRMVWEYQQKYYLPAMKRVNRFTEEQFKALHSYTRWINKVRRSWKNVHLSIINGKDVDEDRRILSAGERKEIALHVHAEGLKPDELLVEVIIERQDTYKGHQHLKIFPMGYVYSEDDILEYRAVIKAEDEGTYRYNCRAMPIHNDQFNKYETRLIKWLD